MVTESLVGSDPHRIWRAVGSARGAAVAHYFSLVAAGALLVLLSRHQWFFFDEWAWIVDPWSELWAGHVGHWSTLPILAWALIQRIFGLGSYAPFLWLALATHLVAAHLLWRITLRVGGPAWISTMLVGIFLILGSGGENTLWAFQFAFIGGLACGLGALLLAIRLTESIRSKIAIAALLLVGASTAGTVLPLVVVVAAVMWRIHGWRSALSVTIVPVAIYFAWWMLFLGPGPQDRMRAQGADVLLTPDFAGSLFARGLDQVVPLTGIGSLIVIVLGLLLLRSSAHPLDSRMFVSVALAGAGVLFAFLSAYSRWNMGVATATSGRYVYFVVACFTPLAALLLARLATGAPAASALIVSVLGIIAVFNVGALVMNAREQAARESYAHEVVSAALTLLAVHPDDVQVDASPDPAALPQTTLEDLSRLVDSGLTSVSPSPRARLTALVNVGLTVRAVANPRACTPLAVGDELSSGAVIFSDGPISIDVAAIDGPDTGDLRPFALDAGAHRFNTVNGLSLRLKGLAAGAGACMAGALTSTNGRP